MRWINTRANKNSEMAGPGREVSEIIQNWALVKLMKENQHRRQMRRPVRWERERRGVKRSQEAQLKMVCQGRLALSLVIEVK